MTIYIYFFDLNGNILSSEINHISDFKNMKKYESKKENVIGKITILIEHCRRFDDKKYSDDVLSNVVNNLIVVLITHESILDTDYIRYLKCNDNNKIIHFDHGKILNSIINVYKLKNEKVYIHVNKNDNLLNYMTTDTYVNSLNYILKDITSCKPYLRF